MVFTAGACPLDGNGHIVSPGDLEAQAIRCVQNLLAALAERGAGPQSLLKTTIFVAAQGHADLVRAWNVVAERLGRAPSAIGHFGLQRTIRSEPVRGC